MNTRSAARVGALTLLAIVLGTVLLSQPSRASAESQTVMQPPIGTIMAYAGPVNAEWENSSGWLLCDGRSISRNLPRYRALFNAIGTTWGGDGAPNFTIPDLRGRFIRGVDKNIQGVATPAAEGGPRDPDRDDRTPASPFSASPASQGNRGNAVGSMQSDIFGRHGHNISPNLDIGHTVNGNGSDWRIDADDGRPWNDIVRDVAAEPEGGHETRPKNAYVYWIIRYQ